MPNPNEHPMILRGDDTNQYPYGVYDYNIIDMPQHKVVKQKKARLTLTESCIKFHTIHDAEQAESNECISFYPQSFNWRVSIRRDRISAINMYRAMMHGNDDFEYWTVEMEFLGVVHSIKIHFELSPAGGMEAKALYDRLERYFDM